MASLLANHFLAIDKMESFFHEFMSFCYLVVNGVASNISLTVLIQVPFGYGERGGEHDLVLSQWVPFGCGENE